MNKIAEVVRDIFRGIDAGLKYVVRAKTKDKRPKI